MSPTRQSRIAIPFILPDSEALASCEIIHTNSFFGIGLTALWAARRFKKPLVGTNHWAFAEFGDYFPWPLSQLFSRAALAYVNWYYGHCDFMSAPGKSTVAEQVDSGFYTKTEAISNPIDTDAYHPATHDEREALRARFGFTGPIVVCVGRLALEKKDDIVVRAFGIVARTHPEATLVFAGHGTFEPTLRAIAAECGITDKVRFLGTLQKSALADLFRASDIYAIASTSETQSMSLLQAFASGLPTVGVQWRAIPDYLNEERGSLFPKDDYAAMATQITALIENPAYGITQGEKAHDFAQQFSIGPVVNIWESIYKTHAAKLRT